MAKTATIQAQQKWEYLTLTRKTDTFLVDELNQLFGQQGWELVSVIRDKDRKGEMVWTAFLKRPFAPGAAAPPAPSATAAAPREETPAEPTTQAPGFDLEGDEFKIKEEPS
ncbi:MAG TPA: hypothetical protein EYP56_20930 [Planctomycetaceae bacterium]|nr:hypothetical protein [Planctomycetaceae bacterium]